MFNPQGNFYPQTGFYPQANFNPPANFGAQAFQGIPGSNWQYPGQQQAFLQQHAIQQLLAQQLAAQQQQQRQSTGMNGQLTPEQFNPTQPHHHLLQQLAQYHHWVAQQLAQLAAQQAIQGSASSPLPYAGQFIPGAGQFGPSQFALPNQFGAGANFVPGITMH
jgi:hypothetical protein